MDNLFTELYRTQACENIRKLCLAANNKREDRRYRKTLSIKEILKSFNNERAPVTVRFENNEIIDYLRLNGYQLKIEKKSSVLPEFKEY